MATARRPAKRTPRRTQRSARPALPPNLEALTLQLTGGVAVVTFNRPAVHNAFDEALIGEVTRVIAALDADDAVRVIVLAGNGPSFSAGADLKWMRRMAEYGRR